MSTHPSQTGLAGVAMLVNEFPPGVVGGAERQAERLAAYLARAGHAVRVLTRAAGERAGPESRDGFMIDWIAARGPGKLRTVTYMLGALAVLWQRRREYAVIHAHLAFGPALAGVLAGRWLGKPVLVKFGNSGEFGEVQVSSRSARGRLRLGTLRRYADICVVLDQAAERELLAAGFRRERVLRMQNGIDAAAHAPRQPRAEAKRALDLQGRRVAMFAGRLVPQKALDTLLRALPAARTENPSLLLVIAGEGPERARLEQQADALGLLAHVRFIGPVDDVRPWMEAADIFVLPSVSEGQSNALLEAMAAGLACVATDVGGTADLLEQSRCGWLVPPGDVQALSRALIALTEDPLAAERLGELARQRVLEHFDLRVVGARYAALYERLTGRPAAPRLRERHAAD